MPRAFQHVQQLCSRHVVVPWRSIMFRKRDFWLRLLNWRRTCRTRRHNQHHDAWTNDHRLTRSDSVASNFVKAFVNWFNASDSRSCAAESLSTELDNTACASSRCVNRTPSELIWLCNKLCIVCMSLSSPECKVKKNPITIRIETRPPSTCVITVIPATLRCWSSSVTFSGTTRA